MSEQAIIEYANGFIADVTATLKRKGMTQRDLAKQLNIKPQQLNQALHFDMRPRSIELRQTVRQLLDMED